MTERVEVCKADALAPGERVIVDHEDGSVGVFNVDDEYHALENTCPHLGGPVCTGSQRREIDATYTEPGLRLEETFTDIATIACPWHGWEFRIATGEHLGDDRVGLRTYDTVVEDGVLYVEI